MTDHNHTEIVPGCYRCELGQDELAAQRARVKLIKFVLMVEVDEEEMEGQNHELERVSHRVTGLGGTFVPITLQSCCDSIVEQTGEWVNDPEGIMTYKPEGSHWKVVEESDG